MWRECRIEVVGIESDGVTAYSDLFFTDSLAGWNLPGLSLGMDDWFTQEDEPQEKKQRLFLTLNNRSLPLQDSTN